MKGDILVIEEYHRKAAREIVSIILPAILNKNTRYVISIAGESGSGKSETAKAVQDELEKEDILAVVLGQDDYFVLPPRSNDKKRRQDPEWLGPHVEVNLQVLEDNIKSALSGAIGIEKPLVDYTANRIEQEIIDLSGVKVVVAEGTYASLLKNVDTRVFINRNRLDTIKHREKRNRGDEVGDPFIEHVLSLEHKIIAGHKQLADFVITKSYDVLKVE